VWFAHFGSLPGETHDRLSNNKKDQRQIRAMVLHFISNSRWRKAPRPDDC
jgi:hypothetical protein